jgi:hypothetical protein
VCRRHFPVNPINPVYFNAGSDEVKAMAELELNNFASAIIHSNNDIADLVAEGGNRVRREILRFSMTSKPNCFLWALKLSSAAGPTSEPATAATM